MATVRRKTEADSNDSDRADSKRRSPSRSRLGRIGVGGWRPPKPLLWTAAILAGLVLLALASSFFLDEPLRRSVESRMNKSLKGYSVRVPELDFHLIGLSVTLREVVIRQQSHPKPPVAVIPRLRASVQWKELFFLRLVADFLFEKPRVYMNLKQLREEVEDTVPVKDRGWQEAALAIYPLKINLLRIDDGELTYLDTDPGRPLHVKRLQLRASNIRNIHSRERTYPSPIHAEAVIFESGRAAMEGHANFLSTPHPGIHVRFQATDVPLDDLRPVAARSDLAIRGGVLSTAGRVEYAPAVKRVDLGDLTIRGVRLDYVRSGKPSPAQPTRKSASSAAANKESGQEGVDLRLDRFRLLDAELGLRDETTTPPYRVFVSQASLEVSNLSNLRFETPARATLEGRFMGDGKATASGVFRPNRDGPDFELKAAVEETELKTLNGLLRAHGNFDVTAGKFSLYSELQVKNGALTGYVKPLFQDIEVYDRQQDANKGLFKKIYENIVDVVANLLENRNRDEVASVVQLTGRIQNPRSNVFQVIGSLIENAFFKAILPGFERELARPRKKRAA